MSLHALAGHMAAKGRGPDSMLVHMTPEEVQSLQVLALKGGGTLTINPETGLPEANFLKKMLPMIAGAALNFFAPGVGTAVGGMFGLGAAAGTGLAVGGISALATGSLSRGLMAGLGAYGGAGLAGSLANAGTGALSSEAANAALAEAGVTDALSPAADEIAQRAIGERLASATPYDKLATGFKAVTDSPAAFGNFAKNNIGAGLAAISAINADEGVQTTTKRPDTGMIRNYTFDPYGQTYTSAGNYPASEYKGMARGGIVALAEGGTPGSIADLYTPGSVEELYKTYAGRGSDPGGLQYWTQQFGDTIDPNEVNIFKTAVTEARGQGTEPVDVTQEQANTLVQNMYRNVLNRDAEQSGLNYWSDMIQTSNDPTKVYNDFLTAAQAGSELGKFDTSFEQATTPFTGYTSADTGTNADEWVRNVLGREVTDADRNQSWYKDMSGVTTVAEAKDAYNDFLQSTGAKTNLDWMSASQLNPLAIPPSAVQNTTTVVSEPTDIAVAPDTALPVGVSGAGVTTINPNGTVTTAPNIPGRPAGGFTGIGQLKDVYTAGGGSTGYVNKAPTTMEEFNTRFNKQTGDSLAAYDYLMGKGANNNAYPTKSGVEQIMRPYSEVTTGIPAAEGRPTQKYIFDAATKRYVENPNYRPLSYNSKGERMVGLTPSEVIKGITPFKDGKDDAGLFDFVTQNRISEAQLAAALGISLAEARARLAAVKKTRAATNTVVDELTGQGGDGAPGPGDDGTGNAAAAAAAGTPGSSAGAAGGQGGTGIGEGGGTGMGGYYKGGAVRRMALGGLGALAKGGVAELPDGAFVLPARITSEVGNGSTNAGAQKLQAMEQRLLGKNAQPVNLGRYSGGGNLVRGAGDGVSDSVPATIGGRQPARIADGEYIVSREAVKKLGNGSTEAGARKLYAMMDRVQKARGKTTGKKRVAANTRSEKYLPA